MIEIVSQPIVTYTENESDLTIFVRNHTFTYAKGATLKSQGLLETTLSKTVYEEILEGLQEGVTEASYTDVKTGLTVHIRVVGEVVYTRLQKNFVGVDIQLTKDLFKAVQLETDYKEGLDKKETRNLFREDDFKEPLKTGVHTGDTTRKVNGTYVKETHIILG